MMNGSNRSVIHISGLLTALVAIILLTESVQAGSNSKLSRMEQATAGLAVPAAKLAAALPEDIRAAAALREAVLGLVLQEQAALAIRLGQEYRAPLPGAIDPVALLPDDPAGQRALETFIAAHEKVMAAIAAMPASTALANGRRNGSAAALLTAQQRAQSEAMSHLLAGFSRIPLTAWSDGTESLIKIRFADPQTSMRAAPIAETASPILHFQVEWTGFSAPGPVLVWLEMGTRRETRESYILPFGTAELVHETCTAQLVSTRACTVDVRFNMADYRQGSAALIVVAGSVLVEREIDLYRYKQQMTGKARRP